jgi:hypothetical protein
LNRLAGGRIDAAVGGGLRLENSGRVVRIIGAKNFDGSLRRGLEEHAWSAERAGDLSSRGSRHAVEADDVRTIIQRLVEA